MTGMTDTSRSRSITSRSLPPYAQLETLYRPTEEYGHCGASLCPVEGPFVNFSKVIHAISGIRDDSGSLKMNKYG